MLPARLSLEDSVRLIYSLDHRRREFRDVGWVYILRNAEYRQPVLKVGKSSRFPAERAHELSRATGVAGRFQVVYFVHSGNMHAAEAFAHQRLADHRLVRNKEFFSCSLRVAIEALDAASQQFPLLIRQRRLVAIIPQCFETYEVRCTGCGRANRFKPLFVRVSLRCSGCQSDITEQCRAASGECTDRTP